MGKHGAQGRRFPPVQVGVRARVPAGARPGCTSGTRTGSAPVFQPTCFVWRTCNAADLGHCDGRCGAPALPPDPHDRRDPPDETRQDRSTTGLPGPDPVFAGEHARTSARRVPTSARRARTSTRWDRAAPTWTPSACQPTARSTTAILCMATRTGGCGGRRPRKAHPPHTPPRLPRLHLHPRPPVAESGR